MPIERLMVKMHCPRVGANDKLCSSYMHFNLSRFEYCFIRYSPLDRDVESVCWGLMLNNRVVNFIVYFDAGCNVVGMSVCRFCKYFFKKKAYFP